RVGLKLSVSLRDFMECGGKRSATPLWIERLVLRWIRHKHQPKRRRASLAAALHMAVDDTFNRTRVQISRRPRTLLGSKCPLLPAVLISFSPTLPSGNHPPRHPGVLRPG